MADESIVTITLRSWPKNDVPSTELGVYYFPGCSVERRIYKDIRIISMSGITKVVDLLRTDDSFRLYGTWLNDDDNKYDGLKSIDRQEDLFELCTVVELYGVVTWDDGLYDETLYVLPHDLNCDQEPGNVGMFGYNFLFAVLAKEPSL